MATTFPHLNELVEDGARGLREVNKRRMFGCDAYFVGDAIFALIWKTGRIGLKLPEAAAYDQLMAIDGAEPWCAGSKQMSGWVLVPEDFHDDAEALTPWVRRSYQQVVGGVKVPAKKVAKAAAKRAAKAAKPAAKKASKPAARV